ncbi:MAG: hypothetical protein ACK5Z5_05645 [Neisseriaceae bacterium]|jgi:hypothetical protein
MNPLQKDYSNSANFSLSKEKLTSSQEDTSILFSCRDNQIMQTSKSGSIEEVKIEKLLSSLHEQIIQLVDIVFSEDIFKEFRTALQTNIITDGINFKYNDWSLLHLCAYYYDPFKNDYENSLVNRVPSCLIVDPEEIKQSEERKFLNLKALINLLLENGVNINTTDTYGRTPICFFSDKDLLQQFIKYGASLELETNDVSPLHVLSSLVNKFVVDHITFGSG